MSLTNSPSLDDYSDGIPPAKKDHPVRKLFVRGLIGVFGIFLVFMLFSSAKDSQAVTRLTGQGKVVGAVVDPSGMPIRAEVFYLGSKLEVQTDASGNFELSGVPAGQVSVVIAKNGAAEAYPITLAAGETYNMGVIEYIQVTPGP